MSYVLKIVQFVFFILFFTPNAFAQGKIDRKALVQRHTIVLTKADTLASLSVGNGGFAFTADITGVQTFPEYYANGIPLGTQSDWGWHSFPNTEGYKIEETMKPYATHGRTIPYGVQWATPERNNLTANYLRQNPHRLQLGNLGFDLIKKDGTKAMIHDLKDIRQTLDMWTGALKSHFTLDDEAVDVQTFCHQNDDVIGIKIKSNLLKTGQIKIRLRFPYPTDAFLDEGTNYKKADKHTSELIGWTYKKSVFKHQLDTNVYFIQLNYNYLRCLIEQNKPHDFLLTPSVSSDIFEFTASFHADSKELSPAIQFNKSLSNFRATEFNNSLAWQVFWESGGAIDLSEATDKRAFELERRIVLSQYLTKIQCTGAMPPQETGLTYNSWFGKPHLEMHWWHGVHFALWGRINLLEKNIIWYKKNEAEAKRIAERQGFDGVRWQKMTDPEGREAPSSVGAFLIWQQPHFIYFAELAYRDHNDQKTLEEYRDLVFKTADFMASYAYYDVENQRFILGVGLMPAQERFKPEETFNPTFELAYWHWALTTAQKWRERLGLKPSEKYALVLSKLSPLPVQNGIYLATESAKDSYTNEKYLTDHPSVLGAFGLLPATPLLDKPTMQRTFDTIWQRWHWADTWGWDFPMTAMTATRLGLPDRAVDALLMPIKTNTYLVNGHNYQDQRLRLYLPGNGGLLAAVALMCTEGGFPKAWNVRFEGLKAMP
jgi:protein-glucosylgalactosylhydroxylysine glucosidase